MSGLNIGRSLVFSKIDTPTREGEVVETVEDIMNIPTPREGMIVYVRSEKKNYVVLSLKEKNVAGTMVPNAQVDEYEELYGALVNMIEHGQISAGRALEANVADKVKDGNVTLESLGDYLRKRVNVADSLDIADPERPLSARQGVVLKEEIARAIETVINGAPGSFDTLKEIADWINSHGQQAADIVAQLGALADEIGREADSRISTDNEIKSKGVLFGGFGTNQSTADKVVISYQDIAQKTPGSIGIPAATKTTAGVMSADDKANLDRSFHNVLQDVQADYINLWFQANGTDGVEIDIPAATAGGAGVMSAEDKKRLDSMYQALVAAGMINDNK